MAYWLFKSEPDTWSWDDQTAKRNVGEEWHGVRNYQARNNMRAMSIGDHGFFYHSGKDREIVGVVEVCAEAHPDSTADDSRWECVDIKAVKSVKCPVTLRMCRENPHLKDMVLVNNSRLSVQPVTADEWMVICAMAGINP